MNGLVERIRVRAGVRARMAVLWFRHRFASTPVTGDALVVVSLTSYGARVKQLHYVVESIGRGHVRPTALIIWLDDESLRGMPARTVSRLRRRGVEVRSCPDYGPHKKQYPYAASTDRPAVPLITADDDCLYPRDWLQRLVAAHDQRPDTVHCHRARRIHVTDDAIAPYFTWPLVDHAAPNFANVAIGVGGTLYPSRLLDALAARGMAFLDACPFADDLWVHATAVGSGIRVCQLRPEPLDPPTLPRSQRQTLRTHNVAGGGNDAVVGALYSAGARRRIERDLADTL